MGAPMTFSALRYIDVPFPSYRFVPGRAPHPTAHPDGHSYHAPGSPPPPVTYYPPEAWQRSPDYLYGCDLYNHGYWWEAHEAWEGLWQLTDKRAAQGRFLQGLIQVSACHLKLHVGHLQGVQRLRRTAAAHLQAALQAVCEPYMGLRVRSWLDQVGGYYGRVLAANPTAPVHQPARYPYLLLEACVRHG